MNRKTKSIIWGVIFIVCGIFLIINQFVFNFKIFPWILLFIAIVIFLIGLFTGTFWAGLNSLIWFGGLTFAFYYNQVLAGILIIIGTNIIISAIHDLFTNSRKSSKIEINIDKNNES